MCGIYAHFSHNYPLKSIDLGNLKEGLFRRGPDNFGYEFALDNKLLLAHSRLSIQDLSPLASQPMNLENSKYIILFNGEVYNHLELRKKYLDNVLFLTDSDTETISKLLDELEIEHALSLLDGMVSLVLFSKQDNSLFLYRDISGQKPLYFSFSKDERSIVISSNPSLFFNLSSNFKKEYDIDELCNYFRCGFTNSTKTIYKRTFSSKPGDLVKINLENLNVVKDYAKIICDKKIFFNKQEINLFDETSKSLTSSLIGTRSCGILLSGGLDSTAVAVGCSELNKISKAYTLFYTGEDNSELLQAQVTSKELGFEHVPVELNIEDGMEVMQNLHEIIDYPNPDPGIISSYVVAREASNKDTILLTGDGGDEMFGGYNRYQNVIKRYASIYSYLPKQIRKKILQRYFKNFYTNFSLDPMNIDQDIHATIRNSYPLLMSLCKLDQIFYMINHTLPKTDRAFMYFSIEGRAPLLNNFFKCLSGDYLKKNRKTIKKVFLSEYIKNRLGPLYSISSKKGFTPFINKLGSSNEFVNYLRKSNSNIKDIFSDPKNKLNNQYFLKINDPNTKLSKRDLRNLWHLYSFNCCEKI